MPTFGDLVTHKDELWRKALGIVIAIAPMSVDPVTSIIDTDGTLKALPTGWHQLGRLSEDGATWPRETDVSELFGNGSTGPGRSDIRRSTKRGQLTLLESKRRVLELVQGIDLSTVTAAATTGKEVTWDEPEIPTYPYMRMLAIARDITDGGEMYIGRQFLRTKVTDVGDETWSDQDQTMSSPLTFTAYHDTTAGTAVRHFRGGVGFAEIVEAEEWTVTP